MAATSIINLQRLSGAHWFSRFPGSNDIRALSMPFRHYAQAFIESLQCAGAKVAIAATYRPVERAYLMHWAWRIDRENADPKTIPPCDGVDIVWAHRDASGKFSLSKSRAAAKEMCRVFSLRNLAARPSLQSRHTAAKGIDMSISWRGALSIVDATGATVVITTSPRTGLNKSLRAVGATYGVIKFRGPKRDDPHWSDTGF
ncbi:peptidoglycan-binding domain-containing protein [Massilia aquatica]|uniref:Peptidoglycan-binding domain-containing protein n=1 Tax=Massilia aquatica TaxID=2609000 RepID=A0ABX0MDP1_9BURK|nr:peptidoglycan-binding domain-containing protein [Massilia aquatica]NHZ40251.1 peptidoglycan-binding domain-containing protein [Massilia aquatica]